MGTTLSVVIPPHNRRDTVRLCLEALARQTVREGWQVVLVDDGSEDGSAEMARSLAAEFPVPLRVVRQAAAGPGPARSGFDESLPGDNYAFEDTELGWRLEQAGMKLVYHPEAWAFHYQFVTFATACRRERRVLGGWPAFLRTPAGQAIAAQRAGGRPVPPWRRRAGAIAARILQALYPLLDTRIPLPSALYREILRYHSRRMPDGSVRSWP